MIGHPGRAIRRSDQSVELVFGAPKLKRVFADADRAGAKEVHMIGPDELERGEVLIRDLTTGEQRPAPLPTQTEDPE